MAKGKHTATLFELVNKSRGVDPKRGSFTAPRWFGRVPWGERASEEGSSEESPVTSVAQAEVASQQTVEVIAEPSDTGQSTTQAIRQYLSIAIRWDQRRLRLNLSANACVLIAAVMFMFLISVFMVGKQAGRSQMAGQIKPAATAEVELQQIRNGALKPDVLSHEPGAASEASSPPSVARNLQETPSLPAPPSRKKGLNYLIIESFKDSLKAYGCRDYLADNNVTATVNMSGNWWQVKGLDGFGSPSSRAAAAYRDKVRALGDDHARRAGGNKNFSTAHFAKEN